jgi:hypothetical protein
MKRRVFQSAFQSALLPLRWLKEYPNGPYAEHLRGNLQEVLNGDGGLPLLFPGSELGFSYNDTPTSESHSDNADPVDTYSPNPQLQTGRLFPHFPVRVVQSSSGVDLHSLFPHLKPLTSVGGGSTVVARSSIKGSKSSPLITTSDLPAQVSVDGGLPPFVLMRIIDRTRSTPDASSLAFACLELSDLVDYPVCPVVLYSGESNEAVDELGAWLEANRGKETGEDGIAGGALRMVMAPHHSGSFVQMWEADSGAIDLVLIRPDGHVSEIILANESNRNDAGSSKRSAETPSHELGFLDGFALNRRLMELIAAKAI